VGKVATRKSVRINDWIELPRIEFGVDEYLDFVGEINGQVWYVLNLKGDIDRLADIDKLSGETHLALVKGKPSADTETLVRVHEPFSVMDFIQANPRHSWSLPKALERIKR